MTRSVPAAVSASSSAAADFLPVDVPIVDMPSLDISNRSQAVRTIVPPVVFGLLFIGLWEAVVKGFNLKPYFLPAPSAIATAFVHNIGTVQRTMTLSGSNALVGLIAGLIVGVITAFALMRFNVLNELISPLAIALNAIPIVVLVAIFQNMYPITSQIPRRLMVTLVVFFIVLVNVAKGLRQVQPTHFELLRSYAATPRQVLIKARIPNAISYLFTALKIAAPTAVITAFVSEYFGGPQDGLGTAITSAFSKSQNAAGWAYVLGACLLGLTFYLVTILLETLITHQRGITPRGGKK